MRRILLVGPYPPPYGGLSVQLAALQRQLLARGDTDVRVVDIGAGRHERRDGCLPARRHLRFLVTVLAHARRGFTVHLHTNGHNTRSWLATLVCVGAGCAGRSPAILSLGSGRVADFVGAARPWLRALARASLAGAGAIIVRNERTCAALAALEPSAAAKLVVLPGFYGVAEQEIGSLPSAAARFTRRHAPVLGAIASAGPEYGIPLLIDAAARLRRRHPRLGVLLVGPDRLTDGCPRWVLPLGERERPSLLAVLRNLDVFVRPTYFDGDALSVREAQALGVRVVASDTDFRPEGVWCFPCGDADALARAIDAALAGRPTRVAGTSLPALLEIYDALPGRRSRRAARAAAVVRAAAASAGRLGGG